MSAILPALSVLFAVLATAVPWGLPADATFILPLVVVMMVFCWRALPGTTLSPVIAMLRTLDRRETMPDVTLVHSAKDESAILFRHELHRMHEDAANRAQVLGRAGWNRVPRAAGGVEVAEPFP